MKESRNNDAAVRTLGEIFVGTKFPGGPMWEHLERSRWAALIDKLGRSHPKLERSELVQKAAEKVLLEYALGGYGLPLTKILRNAISMFDDDHLRTFVLNLGDGLRRGIEEKPILNRVDSLIIHLWRFEGDLTFGEGPDWPPSSRWAKPAAYERLVFHLCREAKHEPSKLYIPKYRTFCKSVERMGLKTERPVLVTKAKCDRGKITLEVTFAAAH